jgi:hypothetical protein
MPELERRFGGWKPAALPKWRSLSPAAQKAPRAVTVVDRPGAAQSELWVGELGVGAGSADLYAAQVASTVLGGGLKSRLNANLRSGKGYTYGAYSAFEVRREPGLFMATAPVVADKTPEALRELLSEIDRLREGGIDATELAEAKSGLIQSLPAEFDTTTSTALAFGRLVALGRPPDYFAQYAEAGGGEPRGRGRAAARGSTARRSPSSWWDRWPISVPASRRWAWSDRPARRDRRGGEGGARNEVGLELNACSLATVGVARHPRARTPSVLTSESVVVEMLGSRGITFTGDQGGVVV